MSLPQALDRHLRESGEPVVAADGVAMAGPGELVYVVASREAALAMPEFFNKLATDWRKEFNFLP